MSVCARVCPSSSHSLHPSIHLSWDLHHLRLPFLCHVFSIFPQGTDTPLIFVPAVSDPLLKPPPVVLTPVLISKSVCLQCLIWSLLFVSQLPLIQLCSDQFQFHIEPLSQLAVGTTTTMTPANSSATSSLSFIFTCFHVAGLGLYSYFPIIFGQREPFKGSRMRLAITK